MIKRCIYCNCELDDGSVVDICEVCMYKVWGPKMAAAIVSGMRREKKVGNMELGRVGETKTEPKIEVLEFEESVVEVEEEVEEIVVPLPKEISEPQDDGEVLEFGY